MAGNGEPLTSTHINPGQPPFPGFNNSYPFYYTLPNHGTSAMPILVPPAGHCHSYHQPSAPPYLTPSMIPMHQLQQSQSFISSESLLISNSGAPCLSSNLFNLAPLAHASTPVVGYISQQRDPLLFVTLPNSELQSYSRRFVVQFGLHDTSFTIPTNGIAESEVINAKAVIPPNLITPNKSKVKESCAEMQARYWMLICKPEELVDQPDLERINDFSTLVNLFREKLGKVILNELQFNLAKELEKLRQASNYEPVGVDDFTTYDMVLKECRSSKDKDGTLFSMLQNAFNNDYGLFEDRHELSDHVMNIFKIRYASTTGERAASKGFVVQFVSQKRSDMKGVLNEILKNKPIHRVIRGATQADLRNKRKQDIATFRQTATPFVASLTAPPNVMAMPGQVQWMNHQSYKDSRFSSPNPPIPNCSNPGPSQQSQSISDCSNPSPSQQSQSISDCSVLTQNGTVAKNPPVVNICRRPKQALDQYSSVFASTKFPDNGSENGSVMASSSTATNSIPSIATVPYLFHDMAPGIMPSPTKQAGAEGVGDSDQGTPARTVGLLLETSEPVFKEPSPKSPLILPEEISTFPSSAGYSSPPSAPDNDSYDLPSSYREQFEKSSCQCSGLKAQTEVIGKYIYI